MFFQDQRNHHGYAHSVHSWGGSQAYGQAHPEVLEENLSLLSLELSVEKENVCHRIVGPFGYRMAFVSAAQREATDFEAMMQREQKVKETLLRADARRRALRAARGQA